MKILVVAATPTELNAIKKWIKSANILSSLDISFLCLWVWNYETIFSLERYIKICTDPVFILNIWICGYWNTNWIIKNQPVQASSVINIHTLKERICPPFLRLSPLGTFISSECVVTSLPDFLSGGWLSCDEYYFDMESWWVSLISSKHKFPYLILKFPFDFIGSNSVHLLDESNKVKTINAVSEMLNSLPYYDYLIKILCWISELNI